MSKHGMMLEKAREVQQNAYAPYSRFKVGVCIRTESEQFFTGCNVENISYGLTQCAEATAIGHMISQGETRIAEVLIVSSGESPCTPCGACRQLINEFASPHTPIHCYNNKDQSITENIEDLLPLSFTSKHLE